MRRLSFQLELYFDGDYIPDEDLDYYVTSWLSSTFEDREDLSHWDMGFSELEHFEE